MITSVDYTTSCISNVSDLVYDVSFYASIWVSSLIFLSLIIVSFLLFVCFYNKSLNKFLPKSINDLKAYGGMCFGCCLIPLIVVGPLAIVSFLVNFWGTIVSTFNSVFIVADTLITLLHKFNCHC
jgi:hypothetical protein